MILFYRNEIKFLCSQHELEILKARLQSVMRVDPHQKGNSYRVRSLYFDDAAETAFHENEAGTDNREKYRIRIYDDTTESIHLEIKRKTRGKTQKEACELPESLCRELILHNKIRFREGFQKPLRRLYLEMNLRLLKPRIIIEYERTAYICPQGNVRITLDRNISFSEKVESFLDERIVPVPVLPAGRHILEVKYDGFIPGYIVQIMELGDMQPAPFSKYYLSVLCSKGESYFE